MKIFKRFKCFICHCKLTYYNEMIDQINHKVWPVGNLGMIKYGTQYFTQYADAVEKIYSTMVELANLTLELGMIDLYKENVESIKQLEPLIWELKTT